MTILLFSHDFAVASLNRPILSGDQWQMVLFHAIGSKLGFSLSESSVASLARVARKGIACLMLTQRDLLWGEISSAQKSYQLLPQTHSLPQLHVFKTLLRLLTGNSKPPTAGEPCPHLTSQIQATRAARVFEKILFEPCSSLGKICVSRTECGHHLEIC